MERASDASETAARNYRVFSTSNLHNVTKGGMGEVGVAATNNIGEAGDVMKSQRRTSHQVLINRSLVYWMLLGLTQHTSYVQGRGEFGGRPRLRRAVRAPRLHRGSV